MGAAFDEFTSRGFAGARMDEIASRAVCNKALVYHYFADKAALFKQVLECKLAQLVDLGAEDLTLDGFTELAGEVFDFYAADPQMVRLAMWEALDFGASTSVPNEAERCERFTRHTDAIARAQDAGAIEPTLDPKHTLLSLMGVIGYWFSFPQNARLICGADPHTPEAMAERRTHVIEIVRRILERK